MKVWLITVGEPIPTDRERLYRTGLLADFLACREHKVVWWTSDFNHAKKIKRQFSQETISVNESLNIHLLKGIQYRSNISLKRIINHFGNAFDFRKKAENYEKPDAIICSYPTVELSYQATKYSKKYNIPIIIDIRDLWPEAIVNLFPGISKLLIKAALFWSFYQSQYVFRHATSIIGVSPKYLKYGLEKAGRTSSNALDQVFPIGYQKMMAAENKSAIATEQILNTLAINPKKFICWFVGYFGQTYDLQPIIDAAKILQQQSNEDIQFVFSGVGDKYNYWLEKSKECDNIRFTGWIDKTQLEMIGRTAKVGLQAYADKAPQGLANKLFEYLSFGLPVLSSLKGENEELIHEHGVGFTYDVNNPQSFLEKLMILYNDSALLEQMSYQAKELMAEKFDNSHINQSIEKHIRQVIEQHE